MRSTEHDLQHDDPSATLEKPAATAPSRGLAIAETATQAPEITPTISPVDGSRAVNRCTAAKHDGTPCQNRWTAMTSQGYRCRHHRRKGWAPVQPLTPPVKRITSFEDCTRLADWAFQQVARGRLTEGQSRALNGLLKTWMQAHADVQTKEQQRALFRELKRLKRERHEPVDHTERELEAVYGDEA
jgi:hypothetical protein